jgi:hypothetical protein
LQLNVSQDWEAIDGYDELRSYYTFYPDLSAPMSTIYDLNKQACTLYVARALCGPAGPPLTAMVDKYRLTLRSLPTGSLAEYAVAWGTFIVAAEATSTEDQEYFLDVLFKHYQHTGFASYLKAVGCLQSIWSQDTFKNWPALLAQIRVFIM